MGLFVVDTLVQYRMRYVIEAKEASHAEDAVVVNRTASEGWFEEVHQKYLGEVIMDTHEISMGEFHSMEKDSPWMGEELIKRIEYAE